jgi:hypothetical protein
LGQCQGAAQRGFYTNPMVAPIFVGQKTVESSVHDSDFEDQLRNISPTHHQWARLIKERLTQEENNFKDLELVIERLSKSRNKADSMKMITPGFDGARVSDSTFVSVFTLPTEKWPTHQENLQDFFAGNPSPVKTRCPHFREGFEAHQKDDATAEQPAGSPAGACKEDPPPPPQNVPFDPMAFLKEWGEKMQMMNQQQLQPQMIVVESRVDKSRENEAKYSNHMSQLLFICGIVDFTPPGSFVAPRIPINTQAMMNILAQPSTVRASHTNNILTTCFSQVPTDLSKRLSPLTTHKSMHHISKNFASALLTANVHRTSLDSLKFETSSITMLTFVGQNDVAKIEAHREAEQLAKNEREFDFVEEHRKILKTTIEGLGMISGMECIVKICANVFCVVTAFFDINGSNPVPFLYSLCIKTIDFVKHLDFIRARVLQLPFIFLNMLQQVLSQLAKCSTNTVNFGLVEQGDDGSSLNIVEVVKISKFVACFFERIENHTILDGSYPDTVPAFTPRDANPNHKSAMSAAAAYVGERIPTERASTAKKAKADVSPPGTPARDRQTKKQRLKPGAGSKDFTKAGLFHCKEGTPVHELFPADLIKKYCSFFCFHNKKCSKPHQLISPAISNISAGGTGFRLRIR